MQTFRFSLSPFLTLEMTWGETEFTQAKINHVARRLACLCVIAVFNVDAPVFVSDCFSVRRNFISKSCFTSTAENRLFSINPETAGRRAEGRGAGQL